MDNALIDDLRRVLNYDPITGVFTNRITRSPAAVAGGIAGYVMPIGYVAIYHAGKSYYAHRIAWAFVHDEMPRHMVIDHINGRPADNRISNLRIATQSQNMANCRGHKDSKLAKGVRAAPWSRTKPFRAAIMVEGRTHSLGYYKTEAEAAAAYAKAATELRGEFARHD